MSVIDFPPPNNNVPSLGTFVVVALDPAASLAVLDDENVETAAAKVKTRKRIVIVDITLGGEPGVSYYRYLPVGSGLPAASWPSVPIAPVTAHPEGRLPISCSKTLPVDSPYVHTTETFEGEVSRIYMARPSDINCSQDDLRRLSRQYRGDMTRMDCELRASGVYDEVLAEGPPGVQEWDSWEGFVESFIRPKYHMWLHVDEAESYADPSTLQDELAELYAIEAEWRERREAEIKAKKDRLQAWRDDVDAPEGPQEDSECDGGDLVPDGAIILPEDAVGEDPTGQADTSTTHFGAHETSGKIQDGYSWCSAIGDASECKSPRDECRPDCAAPPQSATPGTASAVGSTVSTVPTLSSASVTTSWMISARVWVHEAARFKARLFAVLSAFIPGEFW
ncbi:hypothetical protein AURDEDRAFT_167728 [Auricularia subglabra TFB-10046 SS5]|nr:hypothetical protein AURDEDRAFT_167728 [Auricularia subglabra TFB-10046 SS5]